MTATAKGAHSKRILKGVANTDTLNTVEGMPHEGANLEPLPSVLGLVQRASWIEKRGNEINDLLSSGVAGPHTGQKKARLERQDLFLFDSRHASADLAKSIPAKTLGDAAAHIAVAYSITDDLELNHHNDFGRGLRFRQLHRCLASALRVVADVAGVPIDTIGDKWLLDAFERHFPELGDLL